MGQETRAMDIRPVEICPLVWWVQIGDFWFQPSCLCETQSKWTDNLCMCGFYLEAWRRRCDGVLCLWHCLIYLEFKAHLTSMATTALCSDTASHRVCTYWDFHLFFNRTMIQHTSRLCKGYLTKKESDGVLHQITWPPQSPDLNPIEMVWDELDHRVKEKQPTSAQHMWELLQDCWKSIPHEAGCENAKSVQSCHHGKRWLLWRI